MKARFRTNCYDISSLIRKKLELKKCPSCQSGLENCEVDHSEASRAFDQKASVPVISTCLSQCSDCGWWAVRELRADDALYDPPVEEFIVVGGSKKDVNRPGKDTVLWKQVLADKTYWKNPVSIQSTDAIELFGSSQMLLPKLSGFSGEGLFDKVKSVAPILFPILIVILIAIFF